MSTPLRRALVASPTHAAQTAAEELRAAHDWVDIREAELVVALGGDATVAGGALKSIDANAANR